MANYDQRGQRVQSQVNININASSIPELPQFQPLSSWDRFYHYICTILFLLGSLLVWSIAGLFSRSKFPISYVWQLLLVSLAGLPGTEKFSATLNNQKNELYQLRESDLRANQQSLAETSRLNVLNSKINLIEDTIKHLYGELEYSRSSISQILKKLEEDQRTIQSYLEPLTRKYDKRLYRVRRTIQALSQEKTAAERDYESMQKSLRDLLEKYEVGSRLPSQQTALALIQSLHKIILDNPKKIEKSRLTTLRSTYNLLQWLYLLKDNSQQPVFFNTSGEIFGNYFEEIENAGEINLAGISINSQPNSKNIIFYLTALVADEGRNIFPARLLDKRNFKIVGELNDRKFPLTVLRVSPLKELKAPLRIILAVDSSASMGESISSTETKIDQVKSSAKQLTASLFQYAAQGVDVKVAVLSFKGSTVSINDFVTGVGSHVYSNNARDIIQAIDNIEAYNANTPLWEAVSFSAKCSLHAEGYRAIICLTDDQSNSGLDWATLTAQLRSSNIPIFTVGYGSNENINSKDLVTLSEMTNAGKQGVGSFINIDPLEVSKVFDNIGQTLVSTYELQCETNELPINRKTVKFNIHIHYDRFKKTETAYYTMP